MSVPTREELDDEICSAQYCPYISEGGSIGVHGGPNGPYSCEGRYCDEAYDRWRELNVVTCECCDEQTTTSEAESFTDDTHKYYVCEKCLNKGE